MQEKFIEVKKISIPKKRSKDGTEVRNVTGQPVNSDMPEVNIEAIEIADIKSFKRWDFNDKDSFAFYLNTKSVTKIFFKGNPSLNKEKSAPSILIDESYESFSKRMNIIHLDSNV